MAPSPTSPARIARRTGIVTALAALLAGAVSGPAVASTAPAAPTGVRLVSATGTSVTIGAAVAAHATGYRAFASTVRSDVYVANIRRAKASAVARSPRMTIGGFRYTTAPVYYRVETLNGTSHRYESTIHVGGLRPATPTAVQAAAPVTGPYLSWPAAAVTGFRIDQGTDPALTTGHRTYTIRGSTPRFSPYGLAAGHTYYFRVRALNNGTASGYSPEVSLAVGTSQQPLDVMTYNVLEGTTAGTHEGGQVVPSWTSRRAGVVHLIRQGAPDVVAVQEAAAWVGSPQGYGGKRQIDDLRTALGGTYALASTERPPTLHDYLRTGNYLLYRSAAWTAATGDAHGFWWLDSTQTAAYQVLTNRTTGAQVLVVSAHLAVGAGSSADTRREQEARTLIARAGSVSGGRLPIVYAGDFNSDVNRNHAFDGPGQAMQAAGAADAENAAQTLVNRRYNSSNLYLRTPPAADQSIDHLYAPPGVAVASRSVLLDLTHGRFVGVIPSDHNPVEARLYISY